jgi:ribosomal protein S18 acetylase RimI-like enzyme
MDPRATPVSIEPCPHARDGEALAFLRRVFYEEFAFTPDPHLDKDFGSLTAHYKRGRGELWIADQGGRIVATTALLDMTVANANDEPAAREPTGGDAELKRMFLDKELRGLGVGRRLLETAIKHAEQAGFERIVLDSTRDMRAAIALYRAAGFEEIADYNGNKRADIFMALRLPAAPR